MTDYTGERPGDTPLPWDSLVLDRLTYAVSREFSPSFLAEIDAQPDIRTAVFDDAVGNMVVQLRTDILAEKLAEETFAVRWDDRAVFRFPATPWQHLKDRYAPAWFVRRWPICCTRHVEYVTGTKEVSVQQFALFPLSPLRTPDKYRGSRVVRYERAVDS